MFDQDPKSLGFVILGGVGSLIPMVQRYRNDDGSYDKKELSIDLVLVFIAAMPMAWFAGNEMLAQGFERAAFPIAYVTGVMSREIAKNLATNGVANLIKLMTGGKL